MQMAESVHPSTGTVRTVPRDRVAHAQAEAAAEFTALIGTTAPKRVFTYTDGAALGCPDCVTGELHCCPFLWANDLPEPQRTRWLRHARAHLADVIAEIDE